MSDDFWISGEVPYLASAWAVRTGAIRAYVPASLVAISGELGETLSFGQFLHGWLHKAIIVASAHSYLYYWDLFWL